MFDVFQITAENNSSDNFVVSPVSANIVLAMAALGAGGKTADEMKKTLHLSDEDNTKYFQTIVDGFNVM